MAQDWRPGRWRRTNHEGMSPDRPPSEAAPAAPVRLVLTFHPMRETTLVTVITRDLRGHDRWDRREGTFTVDVPMHEIAGRGLREALRTLLRSALEELAD